jgi:DNA ligase-associated metallophosphoesterase
MTAEFSFRGETLTLDAQGVLVWPRRALMAVADLHLEKGSACANAGRLVPPWDSGITLARLAAQVQRHAPRILVAVGDSFHDSGAATRLSPPDRAALADITSRTALVWVRGNHDPHPAPGIAGLCVDAFSQDGLTFRHQAAPGESGEISGHFHPKARIATRAGTIVRPCFICDADKIMLPSFGAFTGGLHVTDPAIARHFPAGAKVFLLGRDRLFRFQTPPGRLAPLPAASA